MQLGYIGLGKMGYNMVTRLLEKKYDVVVFDKNKEAINRITKSGAKSADSLQSLVGILNPPRLIWLMVPHQVVETVLDELKSFLKEGDVIIDGGNSPYKESIRRAKELEKKGIHFLDVGVSGGPRGAREGACLMVGGKNELYKKYEDLFNDIAVPNGCGYVGRSGAGHFVKMVHNGIEYGMMQSLAEGFTVMKRSDFNLDLTEVVRIYNYGSVIESRLTVWLKAAFESFGEDLEGVSGSAAQSGEGSWTLDAAKELGVETPIIKGSVEFRKESEKKPSFTGRVISALRNQFGGHDITPKKQ